jgi:hypothetical protein
MDALLVVALEVEWVLVELEEIPFELLKAKHEGVVDNVVEKQVNALNDSFIKKNKQGISLGHGTGSPNVNTFLVCQVCNLVDHVATICAKIGDFKLKCGKCNLPHKTKNCGFKCGYYVGMGHTENKCWMKGKETKSHSTTNNYLEVLVDDELTM